MILHPHPSFGKQLNPERLRDLLWVAKEDLVFRPPSQNTSWQVAEYLGGLFTGCAVTFDQQGEVIEAWEYREGIQQGLHVHYTDGLADLCEESLTSLAHGESWMYDADRVYVQYRWHFHAGIGFYKQEMDRFGTVLGEGKYLQEEYERSTLEWFRNEGFLDAATGINIMHHYFHYAAVDVCYKADGTAHVACVVFTSPFRPGGEMLLATYEVDVADVAPYEPGSFYKRELPCILAVLKEIKEVVDVVIVDGFVWLEQGAHGLGAHLYDALEQTIPVIGVAKTAYHGATGTLEVLRGGSKSPLWVSAVGGPGPDYAVHLVSSLKGTHRMPEHLRLADGLSRGHS